MPVIKLINRNRSTTRSVINQALTHLTILQTAPNLIPILLTTHTVLQPPGIISQPVLLITSTGNHLTGAFIRHNERKNGETEEQNDE
ncbi:hypothetical protein HanPI659440_Chr05g0196401 [Helianthus annuus]|nr:hypothetical protein HanPI659440_Chr05g0196401 [Helianthus annuus]